MGTTFKVASIWNPYPKIREIEQKVLARNVLLKEYVDLL